ncbi:hypothetical protein [Streptomyces noursei]|uniref:hypothetical protein n=1 Tax=Streptomyces noursei TaxID=1971 RepID=UPI00167405CF|nr:hypothetical protein [Streptomyces noursei]MCZ1021254.1 hypothetical protein [Streptomyces noursei]GGX56250.1 hypothetical protein GCM10010341_91030 [Streptomyces noursei]
MNASPRIVGACNIPSSTVTRGGLQGFSWPHITIDWDTDEGGQVTKVHAREIRPGVAAIGDTKIWAKRQKRMHFNSIPAVPDPTLDVDTFYRELEILLGRLERCEKGKKLINFFGLVKTIPDPDGTYDKKGPDDIWKTGINPRKLDAVYDDGKSASINVVILQSPDNRACAYTVSAVKREASSGGEYNRYSYRGYGAWGTVNISTSYVLLIDDCAMPPELLLAHELIHVAHFVSGNQSWDFFTGDERKRLSKEVERLAREEFVTKYSQPYSSVTKWLSKQCRKEFNNLPEAMRKKIQKVDEVFKADLEGYKRKLLPLPIEISAIGKLKAGGQLNLEEVLTHGNKVCLEWMNGVSGKSFTPSTQDQIADGVAKRYEEVRRVRGTLKDLAQVSLTRTLRRVVREVTEVGIAEQLSIKTRIAYIPTTSRKQCEINFGISRGDIPDSCFSGDGDTPLKNLRDHLQGSDQSKLGKDAVRKINKFLKQPLSSHAVATEVDDDDWIIPIDCTTGETSLGELVDPQMIPEDLRVEAQRLAQDVHDHPEKHPSVASRFSNERLFDGNWPSPPSGTFEDHFRLSGGP